MKDHWVKVVQHIPEQNLVEFASDECKTMMGHHDSVVSRLRKIPEFVLFNAFATHCTGLLKMQALA